MVTADGTIAPSELVLQGEQATMASASLAAKLASVIGLGRTPPSSQTAASQPAAGAPQLLPGQAHTFWTEYWDRKVRPNLEHYMSTSQDYTHACNAMAKLAEPIRPFAYKAVGRATEHEQDVHGTYVAPALKAILDIGGWAEEELQPLTEPQLGALRDSSPSPGPPSQNGLGPLTPERSSQSATTAKHRDVPVAWTLQWDGARKRVAEWNKSKTKKSNIIHYLNDLPCPVGWAAVFNAIEGFDKEQGCIDMSLRIEDVLTDPEFLKHCFQVPRPGLTQPDDELEPTAAETDFAATVAKSQDELSWAHARIREFSGILCS
ncbi:hypothetical protein V8E36_009564, partial [Tilletia maclaganii]